MAHRNNADPPADLQSRLTRLEATQGELRDQIGSLKIAVDRIGVTLAERQKPQWQLLLAAASFVFTLVVGAFGLLAVMGQASLVPVEQRVSSNATRTEEQEARIGRIQERVEQEARQLGATDTKMGEKFSEVETQFLGLSNQTNMRQAEHDRLLRMLWHRVYGEELPGNGIWPVVGKN